MCIKTTMTHRVHAAVVGFALVIFGVALCVTGCASVSGKPDAVTSATYGVSVLEQKEQPVISATLIVLFSSENNSTSKVAQLIASVLGAQIVAPDTVSADLLSRYSLVGFGSGIFDQRHHQKILDAAALLPPGKNQKVFIFSTSGVSRDFAVKNKIDDPHDALRSIIINSGSSLIGEFNCVGVNKNWLFKFIGGMNKGHPDSKDLEKAESFAEDLKTKM